MHWRTVMATALALALASVASAKGPEVFPLAQVRPGQRGYGLTVFAGTTPERFEFEVIGVLRQALPRQDLILVKSNDPKILSLGFARGMSGSPLFIDDKVACAFSYGFPFSRGNIGGCTPIEYMLADARRPRRGPEAEPLVSLADWRRSEIAQLISVDAPDLDLGPTTSASAVATAAPFFSPNEAGLVPSTIPLAVTGLCPAAFEEARRIFAPYGVEPVQLAGGAGGGTAQGPTHFEMGGAIGAQLVRGDMSMVGTGTVSYVDGDTVLAFGHPFFQFGEVYMPAVTSEIHTVVPSINMAFKLASPLNTVGSLVQDRQTSIVVDAKKITEMIPVEVRVHTPAGDDTFRAEVLRHRFLTPALAGLVATNAVHLVAPDVADATVTVESTLHLRGFGPLHFTDYGYSAEGAANTVAGARALRALGPLLFNPFAAIQIDRVEIAVDVAYRPDYAEIDAIRVPNMELPFGERTYVDVLMRPFGGHPYVERIPLTIPERLAGTTVKLEVVPGDLARPDTAPPESLADLIAALHKVQPANTLVATVYTADEGITLAGKVIPNLPDSALDTARPTTSTRRGEAYKSITRTVVPLRQVAQGRQELVLRIQDKK